MQKKNLLFYLRNRLFLFPVLVDTGSVSLIKLIHVPERNNSFKQIIFSYHLFNTRELFPALSSLENLQKLLTIISTLSEY